MTTTILSPEIQQARRTSTVTCREPGEITHTLRMEVMAMEEAQAQLPTFQIICTAEILMAMDRMKLYRGISLTTEDLLHQVVPFSFLHMAAQVLILHMCLPEMK